jgi:hypothetical protein
MKTKPQNQSIQRTHTTEECADELNLTIDQLRDYAGRGCPHTIGKPGKPHLWNPPEVAAWMQANSLTGKPGRPQTEESLDIQAARLRVLNLQARKHALDIQEREKQLVNVADVKQWIGERVTTAKNKLLGMGAALAPLLEGRDAAERQDIIDQRVTGILNELAAEG